jgi:hypothetical protein
LALLLLLSLLLCSCNVSVAVKYAQIPTSPVYNLPVASQTMAHHGPAYIMTIMVPLLRIFSVALVIALLLVF